MAQWTVVIRAILFCLFGSFACAQHLDAEFDASALTLAEKRYLQAALLFDGTYNGLIDGEWGKGSHRALLQSARSRSGRTLVTFRDLTPVLRTFDKDIVASGWVAANFEKLGFSFLLPLGLLSVDRDSKYPTVRSKSNDLLVRSFFDLRGQAVDRHKWVLDNHTGPRALYSSYKDARLITSGQIASGKLLYLRSDATRGGFNSLLIQFDTWQERRGLLIAASYRNAVQPDLDLPKNGVLSRIIVGEVPRPVAPPPMIPAQPEPPPGQGLTAAGSGTGFFVNNTDIVTAAHVVNECLAVTLDDGTPLKVIGSDSSLDLAVLSSPKRSMQFLSLSSDTVAKLGQDIFALGYPYLGLFSNNLSATRGNIGALHNATDPAKKLMITAPIQPGNSGGPVLSRDGRVIGVVVSRANDLNVLIETGTLPQNINFAVSMQPLVSFLDQYSVLFPDRIHQELRIEDGIPSAVQDAVVVVKCLK